MVEDKSVVARKLLLDRKFGVLSTHSVAVSGYLFGSVVPYVLDRGGEVVILVSDIAQHTKNMIENSNVSLTVIAENDGQGDIQTYPRLTYLADAAKITGDIGNVAERYYRYFPHARSYHEVHDFNFYRLKLVRIRYIGGFGQIHWIESTDFLSPNPFTAQEEYQIIKHMNEDHQAALHHYLRVFQDVKVEDDQLVVLVGIDGEGMDLLFDQRLYRFSFDYPINSMNDACQRLVEMTKIDEH